jgi:hypothetical protein
VLNASLLCRGSPSCFSKPRRASSRTARASKNKNNQSKWTSKDTSRKCLRVAGAGEVRARSWGVGTRGLCLCAVACVASVGTGARPVHHVSRSGHPASGAPVDLSSCAPRDRTIALTSWSSRQCTYVRARRPPRGLGLGPGHGHGSRPSARKRGYRSCLFAWGPIQLTLRSSVYKFNPLRRNAGFITRERAKRPQYGICALFLDSVTTQVSGVWVEFVLYSTLINLASRGRQRRLRGFCTSECIGSNH